MKIGNLGKNVKISTALDYASGTADRNGATLDMAGWDGVLMIVKFVTIAAGAAGRGQQLERRGRLGWHGHHRGGG